MLLQNYWEVIRCVQSSKYFEAESASSANPSGIANAIKATNGTDFGNLWAARTNDNIAGWTMIKLYAQAIFSPFIRHYDSYNNIDTLKFRVGTGTTPVKSSDYCLEVDKTSSFLNVMYGSMIGLSNDDKRIITILWDGTNNSSEDILITEVGVSSRLLGVNNVSLPATSNGNYFSKEVLMFRHILETPVLVPAKGTTRIVIQILGA